MSQITTTRTWEERYWYNMPVVLRNDMIAAGRISGLSGCQIGKDCAVCGEKVWQFPKPTYWLQYPLKSCHVVDGRQVCSEFCAHVWFLKHPAKPGQQLELFTSNP